MKRTSGTNTYSDITDEKDASGTTLWYCNSDITVHLLLLFF